MSENIEIYKFGGASVKNAKSIKKLRDILHNPPQRLIVIISAMGKTTNRLESLIHHLNNNPVAFNNDFMELKQFHFSVIKELFCAENHPIYNEAENLFKKTLSFCENLKGDETYDYIYDQIICLGELLSTKIISAYLNEQKIKNLWMDVRGLIKTDQSYRYANVDWTKTEELIRKQFTGTPDIFTNAGVIITQGFLGGTNIGTTTTLGREGSDFSAAIFGYALNAKNVTIWKDVPGILIADPVYFKNSKTVSQLPYNEAVELAYYGAKIIHPKTIKPLQNKSIPLRVKSFQDSKAKGTCIEDIKTVNKIPSFFIVKEDQILLSFAPKDLTFVATEGLSELFSMLSALKIRIHMMQNSAVSFSICTEYDERKIKPLIENLEQKYFIKYNTDLILLTIRNYQDFTINKVLKTEKILLEQKSRTTFQAIFKKQETKFSLDKYLSD